METYNANLLVERSVELAREIVKAGGGVIFENPCDRGDNESEDSMIRDRFETRFTEHAPLRKHSSMIILREEKQLQSVMFPQCALGSKFQKWTTLWYSADLANQLDSLHICTCERGHTHAEVARGRRENGKWVSTEAAAYPKGMNKRIATTIKERVNIKKTEG